MDYGMATLANEKVLFFMVKNEGIQCSIDWNENHSIKSTKNEYNFTIGKNILSLKMVMYLL